LAINVLDEVLAEHEVKDAVAEWEAPGCIKKDGAERSAPDPY
jgi:hypothetical protein